MNNGSRWCVSEESAAVTGVGTGKEGGAAGQARMPGSLLNICFSSPPTLVHAYSLLCPGLNVTVSELLRTRLCSIAQCSFYFTFVMYFILTRTGLMSALSWLYAA